MNRVQKKKKEKKNACGICLKGGDINMSFEQQSAIPTPEILNILLTFKE